MDTSECIAVVVPRHLVKITKSALERYSLLHNNPKICPWRESSPDKINENMYIIYTVLEDSANIENFAIKPRDYLRRLIDISVEQNADAKRPIYIVSVASIPEEKAMRFPNNPLKKAVKQGLEMILPQHISIDRLQIPALLTAAPPSYCIYPPMLLLPVRSLDQEVWQSTLTTMTVDVKDAFFTCIATHMRVTHIAINAPVPLTNSILSSQTQKTSENVLRSPSNLSPLFGDFGPALPPFPTHIPTLSDFGKAFWVSTRQNAITQIWAPRFTMFSAGNVTEKARVLNLASVRSAVSQGRFGNGCSAVDLYAGIGYFTFSYLKAGVNKVLCWDLNPWSVEGLRRGAGANGWEAFTIQDACSAPEAQNKENYSNTISTLALAEATRIIIFPESNVHALHRIPILRNADIPPVRHVNCGMLPDACSVIKIAVEALDPNLGGWVHFHQVVGEGLEMQDQISHVMDTFREHAAVSQKPKAGHSESHATLPEIQLEHVERVKSVAPRKWHVVLDIWIRIANSPLV